MKGKHKTVPETVCGPVVRGLLTARIVDGPIGREEAAMRELGAQSLKMRTQVLSWRRNLKVMRIRKKPDSLPYASLSRYSHRQL